MKITGVILSLVIAIFAAIWSVRLYQVPVCKTTDKANGIPKIVIPIVKENAMDLPDQCSAEPLSQAALIAADAAHEQEDLLADALYANEAEGIARLSKIEYGSEGFDSALELLDYYLSNLGPSDKIAWLSQLPEASQLRYLLTKKTFINWNAQSPQNTRDYLLENPDFPIFDMFDEWREGQLAVLSQQQLFEWSRTVSEKETHETMSESIFGEWIFDDPLEAGEYLNELEVAPQQDPYFHQYALAISAAFPDAALSWAVNVTDSDLRREAMYKAAWELSVQYPDQYDVWLESPGYHQHSEDVQWVAELIQASEENYLEAVNGDSSF
ncbi:hypothetical protein [Rubellicoccus peritrichatus]|uniref:Uncharacterized protein n=1 Tax=Rubellicoccus peritrichatus TaxID=3080537 RepID=A0AAQ3LJU8_9BACT|nr:hypothetical protein [Puniceicoccus sp. CR14]WOO43579.1 hypothetical protein RZN69_10815 [Puniceicoccus sp. CR14]